MLLANGAPNALPVVTIPEPATTGYAVGASGAIGGQAPVAAMEPVAVATPAIAAAPLGYAAAPLGYALGTPAVTVAAPAVAAPTVVAYAVTAPAVAAPAVVSHAVAAPAVAAPAVLGYAGHTLVYGKSPPITENEEEWTSSQSSHDQVDQIEPFIKYVPSYFQVFKFSFCFYYFKFCTGIV